MIEHAAPAEGETYEVLLLDDDPSVRDGVGSLLAADGRSVRTFEDTSEFEKAIKSSDRPLVLLIDIRLPTGSGLDVVDRLKALDRAQAVIAMTAYADLPTAIAAIRAGVVDFLEKPFPRQVLFQAIDRAVSILEKRPVQIDRADLAPLLERYGELSPREREVFSGMAYGTSSKRMARLMGISPRTVEVHRSHVLKKMHAESVVELVHMAIALGLADGQSFISER